MPKRHFETPAALPADAFFGGKFMTHVSPNENKMSDGGRGRASLAVEVWKSSQKWSVQRSAVRSIAWLGLSASERYSMQMYPIPSRSKPRRDTAPDRSEPRPMQSDTSEYAPSRLQ